MVGSPAGGMAIEDVAEETPELIFSEPIDIIKVRREGRGGDALCVWRCVALCSAVVLCSAV